MKYALKRYWVPIVLLILIIAVNAYLGSTERIKPEVFVGILVGSITTFIASMTHFHNTDKFFKELFNEFNTRYDKMNEFLNSIQPEHKLDNEGRQMVVDYLNLCAEEFMWVQKGRIPEHIWKSWKNGIKEYLNNPTIREVFEHEKTFWKNSYYGFFDDVE